MMMTPILHADGDILLDSPYGAGQHNVSQVSAGVSREWATGFIIMTI